MPTCQCIDNMVVLELGHETSEFHETSECHETVEFHLTIPRSKL